MGTATAVPWRPRHPRFAAWRARLAWTSTRCRAQGPAGRISQDDVKEHARRILSSVPSGAAAAAERGDGRRVPARPLPDFQKWGEVERQPWSNIRRATAEHLSYAWNVIPHVTQFDKADATRTRGSAEEIQGSGRTSRRQPDRDRDARPDPGQRGQEVPAVQRLDRHRARRADLQEVRQRRRGGRYRPRAARAGHPQRRSEEHSRRSQSKSINWRRKRATGSSRSRR